MKRLVSVTGVSALLVTSLTCLGNAASRFDQRLPIDKQIVHVLNRLTFGPRPGDLDQVRRLGVDTWIDLQLHPDRITEEPVLETKLTTLTTLQLPMWQLLEKYPAIPAALMVKPPTAFSSLPQQQIGRLLNCSADERRTALDALDPEVRRLVLIAAPPQVLDGLPDDLREEATSARKVEQEERQKQIRRLRPPLNELLSPDQIRVATRGTPEEKLALLDSFDPEKRQQIIRALPPQAYADVPELRREAMAANQPQQFVNAELIEHKLFRALYSKRQLEEVLVDFWMNHFNVFNGKGPDRVLLTSFERDAIRPHVFGHFKDMLLATARHPAMLFYLDNWQSQAPREDFPVPAGVRRPGLNENYGRELMELHTLGVNGGYTQNDVIAVARAFTGWTIYDPQKFAEFQFNPAVHDRKEKVVLGHTIPAMGGEQDGLDVIDILAHHPSTATFISRKLAQRFVADDPPQALVDRMAASFTKTDGDLRAVLHTMFSSPEFLSEGAWQAKLKSPLEMVVSAARALNADVTDTFGLAQRIADLGEPLYGKLEPTGYPNTGEAWTNTAGVLGRINFATALGAGQILGLKVDISRFNFKSPSAVAADVLNVAPSPSMLAAIEKGVQGTEATPSVLATLVLSSPDFQRR
ncbi:MAG: hypothetical protein DMF91_20430 [Acidobacteria bacterium]|nr:MAG: hypothetical protein DMF91_20430 [Acidobacteriota bacterium]